MVVEVLSPDDETYEKFPFYAARGVEEVIVADPQTGAVQIWRRHDDEYAEAGRSELLDVAAADLTRDIDWP